MALLNQKKVLFAKSETVYGFDAAPTGTDAVLCTSIDVKPLNQTLVEVNNIKPWLGGNDSVVASQNMTVDVEMVMGVGGNTSGVPVPGSTPPPWDVMLKACGFQRTTTVLAIADVAQGGSRSSITLAAGSSATDDFFAGLNISIASFSGTARNPDVVGDAQTVKLAASTLEFSGTLAAGSTTTSVVLAGATSAEDDYYVGYKLKIGSDIREIGAYNATTKTVTLPVALPSAPAAATAFSILYPDTFFDNQKIRVRHFNGTILNAGFSVAAVRLPATVNTGGKTLVGLLVAMTTGAVTELRRITIYDAATRQITFHQPLTVAPTSATTFQVKELVGITGFDGDTGNATLARALRFVTSNTTLYEILVDRVVASYNGTTKVATLSVPFGGKFVPSVGTNYVINANYRYTPVSGSFKSATLYFFLDGVLHSCTGAHGTVSFDFSSGQLPTIKFSFTGLVGRYENNAPTGVDFSSYIEPLAVNYANTENISIAGYSSAVLDKFSIDLGIKVVHQDMPGLEAVRITERLPKGQVSLEQTTPDNFDFYALMSPPLARNFFVFSHGPSGQQISVYMPRCELSNPSMGDKDGVAMLNMDIKALPKGTGDNEIAIIVQ